MAAFANGCRIWAATLVTRRQPRRNVDPDAIYREMLDPSNFPSPWAEHPIQNVMVIFQHNFLPADNIEGTLKHTRDNLPTGTWISSNITHRVCMTESKSIFIDEIILLHKVFSFEQLKLWWIWYLQSRPQQHRKHTDGTNESKNDDQCQIVFFYTNDDEIVEWRFDVQYILVNYVSISRETPMYDGNVWPFRWDNDSTQNPRDHEYEIDENWQTCINTRKKKGIWINNMIGIKNKNWMKVNIIQLFFFPIQQKKNIESIGHNYYQKQPKQFNKLRRVIDFGSGFFSLFWTDNEKVLEKNLIPLKLKLFGQKTVIQNSWKTNKYNMQWKSVERYCKLNGGWRLVRSESWKKYAEATFSTFFNFLFHFSNEFPMGHHCSWNFIDNYFQSGHYSPHLEKKKERLTTQ